MQENERRGPWGGQLACALVVFPKSSSSLITLQPQIGLVFNRHMGLSLITFFYSTGTDRRVIAQAVNLMNFLQGPKQFTPLLQAIIASADKGFISITGVIIPICQPVAICDRFTEAPRSSVLAVGFHRTRRYNGSYRLEQQAGSSNERLCCQNIHSS